MLIILGQSSFCKAQNIFNCERMGLEHTFNHQQLKKTSYSICKNASEHLPTTINIKHICSILAEKNKLLLRNARKINDNMQAFGATIL